MVTSTVTPTAATMNPREKALEDFRKKVMEHKEIEARLKKSHLNFERNCLKKKRFCFLVREDLKVLTKEYDKSENDLKALQSVGQVTIFL